MNSISIGNGSIMLVTTCGIVLARAPGATRLLGVELPEAVRSRITAGTTDGSYQHRQHRRPCRRIFSARHLQRYPLIVAVGLAAEDVFCPTNVTGSFTSPSERCCRWAA